MQNYKQKFNQKGNVTVEAALTIPLIFLIILTLIYVAIMFYEKTYSQTLADTTAQGGAICYANEQRDPSTGKITEAGINKTNIYRQFSKSQYMNRFISAFGNWTSKNINKSYDPLIENNASIVPEITDILVYRKIGVSVNKTFYIPFSGLLGLTDVNEAADIGAFSVAIPDEPAEFIRNIDFAAEFEQELETKYPQLKTIREKITQWLSGLKQNVIKFIE